MLESNLRTASVEDGRDSTSQELHRGLLFFCLDPGCLSSRQSLLSQYRGKLTRGNEWIAGGKLTHLPSIGYPRCSVLWSKQNGRCLPSNASRLIDSICHDKNTHREHIPELAPDSTEQ